MDLSIMSRHWADYNTAMEFLRSRGVLRCEIPKCNVCFRKMSEIKYGRGEQRRWRCPSHNNSTMSLLEGSFLQKQNISLQQFIKIVYVWALQIAVTTSVAMVGLSKATLVQWYSYLRDVCSNRLVNNYITIGGPGHIVQINESLVTQRKSHQGRPVPERWVFGGIDTETNIGFLVCVENRSAEILIPLIKKFILPGTTIYSHSWRAYNNIADIDVNPKYTHQTFTNVHTNRVECMWKNCQKKFRAMLGVHSTTLPSHLDEYMWRQQHGRTYREAFDNILQHISEWYDPNPSPSPKLEPVPNILLPEPKLLDFNIDSSEQKPIVN